MKERIRYFSLYLEFSTFMWILIQRNQSSEPEEPTFGTQGTKFWNHRDQEKEAVVLVSYMMIPFHWLKSILFIW